MLLSIGPSVVTTPQEDAIRHHNSVLPPFHRLSRVLALYTQLSHTDLSL